MQIGRVVYSGKFEDMNKNHTNGMQTIKVQVQSASNCNENEFIGNKEREICNFGIEQKYTQKKVYQEVNNKGKVDLNVYKSYVQFAGGFGVACFIILLYVLAQICECAFDIYMTQWIDEQQEVINLGKNSTINKNDYEEIVWRKDKTLAMYLASVIMYMVFSLMKNYALLRFCRIASIGIHEAMVSRIVAADMSFFDSHFIGNIINRFSHDLNVIDETIPLEFPYVIEIMFACIGEIIVITTVNWIFLIPACIFFFLMVWLRVLYIPTGRSLKRLEAAAKSPLVGHINLTLEGLTTIRAFKAQQMLKNDFDKYQDHYTSAQLTNLYTITAFGFYMDFFSFLFTVTIIARLLFFDHDFSAGNVGLALTQVFILTSGIKMAIGYWAALENDMTSVERALEYSTIEHEENSGAEMGNWPREGCIAYENVTLKYERSKGPVLKKISFSAKPGQKIGIVGRTGAGKSSVLSTLFRLYNYEGHIRIDDINITSVSLNLLRKSIAIIPQDPILFTGTIRSNIDPNEIYSDDAIWKACERIKIKSLIPSLDMDVEDNGSQFSVGQKQLICLARVALDKYMIVVLDEATANMDSTMDKMLHDIIEDMFSDCTMFIIAHRLHSVMNCDNVMVLDNGRIVEFDNPRKLLKNQNSVFYSMSLSDNLE